MSSYDDQAFESFMERCQPLTDNFGQEWWDKMCKLLFQKFNWVHHHDWKIVVDKVLQTATFAPRLARFYQVLELLGIGRAGDKCPDCDGSGGRPGYFRVTRSDGTTYKTTAFIGCNTCYMPKILEQIGEKEFVARVERDERDEVEITEEEFFKYEGDDPLSDREREKLVGALMHPSPETQADHQRRLAAKSRQIEMDDEIPF